MGEKTVHITEFTENGGYHVNISKRQSVLVVMIPYVCSAPFKHYLKETSRHLSTLINPLQDNFIDEEAEEHKI